jgi:CheY-like chemotaxis protein
MPCAALALSWAVDQRVSRLAFDRPLRRGTLPLQTSKTAPVRACVLPDAGFHVVEARDGVKALATLELRDDVGAVFTHVAMPNMNGMALAKIVDIGIVVTSGAIPPELKFELPAGARFLQKPYRAGTLGQEIQAVLPLVSAPVALHSVPTIQAGRMHGAGGIAQPVAEPQK